MGKTTWIVHWEGPFSIDEAKQKSAESGGYVINQLSGQHHLYGSNVLLYIGQTSKDKETRLVQHKEWINYEYDKMTVRLGSITKFKGWGSWENNKKPYPKPSKAIIEKIEKLLIFANQPAYNQANKESARNSKGIRIFNTGYLGPIFPEVSSWYFLG